MVGDAVRLAVGTLTGFPVAAPRTVDRRRAGLAMCLSPLVALGLMVLPGAAVAVGLTVGIPTAALGVACVILFALQSRALHLDGLADTADGLTCTGDRARAWEVMRRGDTGPAGAAALVLTLLLQAVCLGWLLGSRTGIVLAALAVVLSRVGMVWACTAGMPAARADGLGRAVAESVGRTRASAVTAAVLAAGAGALVLAGSAWWYALVVGAGAGASAAMLLARCRRRLGGVTGDVLGATVELTLAGGLLVATACH